MSGVGMGAAYWRDHASRGPALKPLGKPCHDCAVVWGFYADLSDDLARQPADVISAVSANWFCHDNPGRACAGNIENIKRLSAAPAPPAALPGDRQHEPHAPIRAGGGVPGEGGA